MVPLNKSECAIPDLLNKTVGERHKPRGTEVDWSSFIQGGLVGGSGSLGVRDTLSLFAAPHNPLLDTSIIIAFLDRIREDAP